MASANDSSSGGDDVEKVEDAVNWNSGKVMPKGRFTDALEGAWEDRVEEQEVHPHYDATISWLIEEVERSN